MYTIIYTTNKGKDTEIVSILNGEITAEHWNPGDLPLEYKICTSNEELETEAALLDVNWRSGFRVIYIKNI